MKKTKVALIDDHKLFRDGLSQLINEYSGFQVVIEADNGKDFIRKMEALQGEPDIALLDINMKEMDGFETAEWLRQHHPGIKVLVLSMYENENSVIRMLRLGARGYVLKDIRKQELQQALSSLVEKGYYYTDHITGRLIHAINNLDETKKTNATKELVSLSPNEIDFLKLICSELTYKEIAKKMNLSTHTIDGYRDNLFEKLNIRSRVGLVLYSIKNKLFFVE
jgi:two-component system, NarL family, invasion response regulator UvrY